MKELKVDYRTRTVVSSMIPVESGEGIESAETGPPPVPRVPIVESGEGIERF